VAPAAVTAESSAPPAATGTPIGTLQIDAVAGTEIWIDGHNVGEAPLPDMDVPAGVREVHVRHPERGERRLSVTVREGQIAVVPARLEPRVTPEEAAASMPALAAPSLDIIR
jgi:hypothetical protein